MPSEPIKDFRLGLDSRRYFLSSPAGSLTSAINCHISQGGELEKRKAFVKITLPSAYTGNTKGIQEASNGIYLFGSTRIAQGTSTRDRNTNVARLKLPNADSFFIVGDVVNISGMADTSYNGTNKTITAVSNDGIDQHISYASTGSNEALNTVDTGGSVIRASAVLPSPFIYELLVYPGAVGGFGWQNYESLLGVTSSTNFGGIPFVIGHFTDGYYPYYGPGENYVWNGSGSTITTVANASRVVEDAIAGLQLNSTAYDSGGHNLLDTLDILINASGIYTGTYTFPDVEDIKSVPTALNGTPYTVTDILVSKLGTLAIAQQTTGQASTQEAQAVGSFQIIKAGSGTLAGGSLTNTTDANPADAETVVVGTITYTFKNTPAAPNDVKRVAGNIPQTITNLALAINASGVAGTNYFAGTVPNPTVMAVTLNVTTPHYSIGLAAIAGGTAGNSIALGTSSGGNLVRSAATLTGATDSKINQIVVNGATNLLSAPVSFSTDETTFAAAIVSNINDNVASGYQANSNAGTVTILKQVAGSAPNGFTIQVQSQGSVICGTGAFSLTGSGFTIDFIKANGVDLVTQGSLVYSAAAFNQVLANFCGLVANSINAGTATHGYNAFCAQGSISIYIAKATCTSNDPQQVLDISVTPAGGQTGSAIPVTVTPLTVALDINAAAIGVGGKSAQVTASVGGGVSPYTYNWIQQGANAIGIVANQSKKAATTFSSPTNVTIQQQLRAYQRLTTQTEKDDYLAAHPALKAYLAATQTNQVAFVCVVTDALGEIATSDPVYITLLGN